MKELEDTSAEPRPTRELFVLVAGGSAFAVRAEDADAVAEGLSPAPLPHAPAAVLGVVSLRGRMRTLLYPPALLSDSGDAQTQVPATTPRFAVALRGDEQLALAADEVEGPLELDDDSAAIPLLDPSCLFEAAMRGTERRRQRS